MEPGAAALQPPTTDALATQDNPGAPSGAAPALPAAQTCQCSGAPADPRAGAAQEPTAPCETSEDAAQQASAAPGTSEKPAGSVGVLPGPSSGTEAAADEVEPRISLPPSKGLEPTGAIAESVRPEPEAQQKEQHAHKQGAGGVDVQMLHEHGAHLAQSLPSASESLSQSAGSTVLQGFVADPLSQARCRRLPMLASTPACDLTCVCDHVGVENCMVTPFRLPSIPRLYGK